MIFGLAAVMRRLARAHDRASHGGPGAPSGFEDLAASIRAGRFRHSLGGVQGWLSQNERRALYALARWLPGPFLEIGAWAGLSTACMAYGIRDSGEPKTFVTTEINPALDNFRPYGRGVGLFLPRDSTVPCGVSSVELFKRDIRPVLSRPGGVLGALNSNLQRLGLHDLVQIVEGDFRRAPRLPYQFVFADTMHDQNEISTNAPALRDFLSPGTVLACHDTTPDNEVCLRALIPLGRSFIVDSLLVAEVVG